MGANSSPLLADLCLSYMEFKFLMANRDIARSLQHTVRYIDDVATFGTERMKDHFKDIYPQSLPLSFDDTSTGVGHYLDLNIDRNTGSVELYDKRRDFDFGVIRFPEKCSNQPARMGLNVLFAQAIRIARICSDRGNFLTNMSILVDTIRDRGYNRAEISGTLRKVRSKYAALFGRHGIRRDSDWIVAIGY